MEADPRYRRCAHGWLFNQACRSACEQSGRPPCSSAATVRALVASNPLRCS